MKSARRLSIRASLPGLFLCLAAAQGQDTRRTIERADQLPVHSYPIAGSVSKVLADDAAFRVLMRSVRRDLEADMRTYRIADRATLRNYYGALLDIAVLESRFSDARRYIGLVAKQEEKEAAKLLSGKFERAIIDADQAQKKDREAKFSATLDRELAALPYESVQAELKAWKGGWETLFANVYLGVAEEQLDPAVQGGVISLDIARSAIETKYTLNEMVPFRDAAIASLQKVINAHRQEKPDIWAARNVSLESSTGLTNVVTAIWDTGTDVTQFRGRIAEEDRGGSVIGGTWQGQPSPGPMRPMTLTEQQFQEVERYSQGFNDMEAAIDSAEADAVRRRIGSLPKDEVKPFLERRNFYLDYAHGTHVAGIAADGNPAIRLLVARIEFPYELKPPRPTEQWAERQANMLRETIAYFKAHSVRVVNMSWGNSPKEIEGNLEVNREGGSPEERRALARRYFNIISDAFRQAIEAAPEILFVSAAGNTNDDSRFNERIPISYALPNTLSVGAVDKAGDEAFFTTVGKVDLYANGYEVESIVPGGDKQKWSGTSMASPQVVNLAAKLLAKYPALTTDQLRRLILDGSDPKSIGGDREIRLMNPKRSFEIAASRIGADAR
jgi:subtilisin family serine protease